MPNYIETISGRKIDFFNPDPNEIVLEDIFHSLRSLPRFLGHTTEFYSVATHSMNVSILVPNRLRFKAFLHDAAEAFLGDMPTPFKALMPDFKEAEKRIWEAICARFNMSTDMEEEIKHADKVMLMVERDYLKPAHGHWGDEYENVVRFPRDMFHWRSRALQFYLDTAEIYNDMRQEAHLE